MNSNLENTKYQDLSAFFYETRNHPFLTVKSVLPILKRGIDASKQLLIDLTKDKIVEPFAATNEEFVEVFEKFTNLLKIIPAKEYEQKVKNYGIIEGPFQLTMLKYVDHIRVDRLAFPKNEKPITMLEADEKVGAFITAIEEFNQGKGKKETSEEGKWEIVADENGIAVKDVAAEKEIASGKLDAASLDRDFFLYIAGFSCFGDYIKDTDEVFSIDVVVTLASKVLNRDMFAKLTINRSNELIEKGMIIPESASNVYLPIREIIDYLNSIDPYIKVRELRDPVVEHVGAKEVYEYPFEVTTKTDTAADHFEAMQYVFNKLKK